MLIPDDPWRSLEAPGGDDRVSALRVDPDVPWNFFWGRDARGRYLLLFQHSTERIPVTRLPNLRGIDVTDTAGMQGSASMLVFTLLDSNCKDIFFEFGKDLVGRSVTSNTEQNAIDAILKRVWRWHHLLRGGSDDRLSRIQQQGLIGELLTLERFLLGNLSPVNAIGAWQGPLGAAKDFEVGFIAIESKARRGSARPFIAISSEYQLDTAGMDSLFLHVIDVAPALSANEGAVTLTDVARRIQAVLRAADENAALAFEDRLMAAGFDWEADYSDSQWIVGDHRLYLIEDMFPKIEAGVIATGVSNVNYELDLNSCSDYLVANDVLAVRLKGIRE